MPRLNAPAPHRRRTRMAATWTLLLAAGAGLLAAGCSSGGVANSGASANGFRGSGAARPATAGMPAAAGGPAHAAKSAGSSAAGPTGLTSVPIPGGQSIIFTATLRLHAADVQATVARATQLAEAAGGYVSGEQAIMTPSRHVPAMVTIQFKIPAAVYHTTLGELGSLGTKRSETQQAQDVTGTVADVNSRVASAEAAITQLRQLLAHAGTVGGLLSVQDQINQEEASLEALQAQQRALARETSYATISMTITGKLAAAARRHAHKAGGFLTGLAAGWRALRLVVSGLLTGAGAALPFIIPLGLAALAGLYARRWLGRRRSASASPGGVTGPAS